MITRQLRTSGLPQCPRCNRGLQHYQVGVVRPSGVTHRVECPPCGIRSSDHATLAAALADLGLQLVKAAKQPTMLSAWRTTRELMA